MECLDDRYPKLNIHVLELIFRLVLIHAGGYRVTQLVQELFYKPEGRGFDSRLYNWNFSFT